MSDENNISDDEKEAQQASQEYYKNNFSGQTPAGSTTPSTQQTNPDDDEIQKSALDYVKNLSPQISQPAQPFDSQKGNKPRSLISANPDSDQLIKDSLGLGAGGIGAYGAHKNWSLPKVSSDVIPDFLKPGEGAYSQKPDASKPSVQSEQIPAAPNPEDAEGYFGGKFSTGEPESMDKYIASQLFPGTKIKTGQLQDLTGVPIRNNSGAQAAIATLGAKPAQRIAKTGSIDPATGLPRKIYTTIPAKEATDLSPYQQEGNGTYAPVGSPENNGASDAEMAYIRNKNSQPAPQSYEELASIAEQEAQKAKYLGWLNGGLNVASKGLGAASAAYNGYDAYADHRDHGWNLGTFTKGLASLGGLASMYPGGQLPGALAQMPEQLRKTVNDTTPVKKSPNYVQRDLGDLFLSGGMD